MSTQVDPYASPISGFLSKITFGTLAGKNDPIARVLEIDHDSIEKRMADREEAERPKTTEEVYGKQAPLKTVKKMEQRRHGAAVFATQNYGKEDESGIAGAAIKLGGKRK